RGARSVEAKRCPEGAAGRRNVWVRIAPRAPRGSGIRNYVEAPNLMSIALIKSVHVPGDAVGVAAGIAHEDQPIPGERRHRHTRARTETAQLDVPDGATCRRVERHHVLRAGAAEQAAVRVRRAPVGLEVSGGLRRARLPAKRAA